MIKPIAIALCVFASAYSSASAGADSFSPGPVFEEFGPVADVTTDFEIPKDAELKHSFDVSKKAEAGDLNRTLVSAARFINMHARAGVPVSKINVAVIVHGNAVMDVAHSAGDAGGDNEANANAALIEALTSKGVRIIVCGQSAAYYDVANEDLLPGVEMALSAMTAHAVLQDRGYTLNPF